MKTKSLTIALAASFLIIAAFVIGNIKKEKTIHQATGCFPAELSGSVNPLQMTAFFEGKNIRVPNEVIAGENENRSGVLGKSTGERWIEVDLTRQLLRAWEKDELFLETAVSTGLPWWPTPTGEFEIWIKLRATKMEGGSGKYYYYLPNVPYVMFFENEKVPGRLGYGLHGTYWHSDFGTPRSRGCINLPTDVAGVLYDWTSPSVPAGKWVSYATKENPGTRIVIHD